MSVLDDLALLPDNWDSYGAKAPTAEALDAVRSMRVTATPNQGVRVDFTSADTEVEVEFDSRGLITSVTFDRTHPLGAQTHG